MMVSSGRERKEGKNRVDIETRRGKWGIKTGV
jgi:hypothetical protein